VVHGNPNADLLNGIICAGVSMTAVDFVLLRVGMCAHLHVTYPEHSGAYNSTCRGSISSILSLNGA